MLDQGIRIPAGGRVECLGFVVVTWDFVFFGYVFYVATMIHQHQTTIWEIFLGTCSKHLKYLKEIQVYV